MLKQLKTWSHQGACVRFNAEVMHGIGVVEVMCSGPLTPDVFSFLTGPDFWSLDDARAYVIELQAMVCTIDYTQAMRALMAHDAVAPAVERPAVAYVVSKESLGMWRALSSAAASRGRVTAAFPSSQSKIAGRWAAIQAASQLQNLAPC